MVSDDDIRQIVTATGDIREACRRLIQRANERGGEDNITAVLIKIEETDEKQTSADSTVPPKDSEKTERGARNPENGIGKGDKTGT